MQVKFPLFKKEVEGFIQTLWASVGRLLGEWMRAKSQADDQGKIHQPVEN